MPVLTLYGIWLLARLQKARKLVRMLAAPKDAAGREAL